MDVERRLGYRHVHQTVVQNMRGNFLGLNTLRFIWSHPGNEGRRLRSIGRLVQWQLHKRLRGTPQDITLVPGMTLRCYPNSHAAGAVMYTGLYDYDDMSFLLRYLRTTDAFLDIGANIGVYTLLAASRIQEGSIFSIEALPENHRRLEENIRLNELEHVTTHALAVSSEPGEVVIDLADGDSEASIAGSQTDGLRVPADTLDNLFAERELANLTLGKMDIEGAEMWALQGGTQLLERHQPPVWIMEVSDMTLAPTGYTSADLMALLSTYAYAPYRYDAQANALAPMTLDEQSGYNVLAIHEPSLAFVHERLQETST